MRVLVVSPVVPYEGIPHAGGLYLQRHLRAVSRYAEVHLIAPATAENRQAVAANEAGAWHVSLVSSSLLGRPLLRPLRKAANFVTIALPPWHFRGGLESAIREAEPFDVLELQWQEYAALAATGREVCPDAAAVGVVHDVISQKLARDRSRSGSRTDRLRAVLTGELNRRIERRTVGALDRVVVFSEKDAGLLRAAIPAMEPVVLPPPLAQRTTTPHVGSTERAPRVVFVGAMNRRPNLDGARWLLKMVWPLVRKGVPDARLIIAGGGASTSFTEEVSSDAGVTVTGYVEDLEGIYDDASVVVVPLLSGAGLKFKVAEAMLAGRAVVSTTVGAEGYPQDRGIFWAVTDDAREFADEVVRALRCTAAADDLGAKARAFANERFDASGYDRAVRRVHEAAAQRRRDRGRKT